MCLAVPGRVVEITDTGDIAFRVGKVDFGGIRKEINLAYTPEAKSANTFSSTLDLPSASSTKKKPSASSSSWKKWVR